MARHISKSICDLNVIAHFLKQIMNHITAIQYLFNTYLSISIVLIFVIKYSASLRDLLKYGKTNQLHSSKSNSDLISFVLSLKVYKKRFTDFYVVSSVLSLYLLLGCRTDCTEKKFGVIFMSIQSFRRLYECLVIFKPSNAKMNILHYIMGMNHYVISNANLWLQIQDTNCLHKSLTLKVIAVMVFIVASLDQHKNHKHLSSLKKYTKPHDGLFGLFCCAHYFDEMVVYGAMACVGNSVSVFCFLFVVVNLGVSWKESSNYYKHQQKTGSAKTKGDSIHRQ